VGRFRVKVTKIGGTDKDPDPTKLYANIYIFDDDESVPIKYKNDKDPSGIEYNSIGFISIHPKILPENISMYWYTQDYYDEIIAWRKSIEKKVIEIAKDAYNRIKKDPDYKVINNVEYSYD